MNDLKQTEVIGSVRREVDRSKSDLNAVGNQGVPSARPRSGRVLVLGSDTRSFLSVVRSLGRYGLDVEATWTQGGSNALRSRYLKQTHELPLPWNAPEGWLGAFNELLSARDYDLVVPCNDPALIPLQQSRDELHRSSSVYLLDDRTFEISQSKILSSQLAATLQVHLPRTAVITDVKQGLVFAKEAGYPVVLKPAQSYSAAKLQRKSEVLTVRSEAELLLKLTKLLEDGEVLIQEYFTGVGTGIEFLARDGKLLYCFQHLRLHEPLKGGGSSYRMSIELHPEMLDATQKLVASLDYSGVGMVEFRWDRHSNRWIFVEINGRFWGSLPLAIACGADFPKFLYQSFVEHQTQFPSGYRVGICCRNWERDKNWMSERWSTDRSLAAKARSATKGSWATLGRLITLRERCDTYTVDDPDPFYGELRSIVQGVTSGAIRKLRSRVRRLGPVRSSHRRRLRERLASAKKVVFVCKGNICRSPFAAAYAQTRFPESVTISSAGYYPVTGRCSPSAAQQAARRLGIDLEPHRSNVLSSQQLLDADLVFVFDEENLDRISQDHPGARRKTFLLGHVLDRGSLFIEDPYGGNEDRFLNTYLQISECLNQATKWLGQKS